MNNKLNYIQLPNHIYLIIDILIIDFNNNNSFELNSCYDNNIKCNQHIINIINHNLIKTILIYKYHNNNSLDNLII